MVCARSWGRVLRACSQSLGWKDPWSCEGRGRGRGRGIRGGAGRWGLNDAASGHTGVMCVLRQRAPRRRGVEVARALVSPACSLRAGRSSEASACGRPAGEAVRRAVSGDKPDTEPRECLPRAQAAPLRLPGALPASVPRAVCRAWPHRSGLQQLIPASLSEGVLSLEPDWGGRQPATRMGGPALPLGIPAPSSAAPSLPCAARGCVLAVRCVGCAHAQ